MGNGGDEMFGCVDVSNGCLGKSETLSEGKLRYLCLESERLSKGKLCYLCIDHDCQNRFNNTS